MSKKFLEQVSSTGISRKKVESKFGMKILAKCGWAEGEGLGKNKDGIIECIQIRKREDNLGLGASVNKAHNWNDQWWQNSYDSILKNVQLDIKNQTEIESEEEEEVIIEKTKNKKRKDSSDDDGKSNTSTTSENSEEIKSIQKKKKKLENEEKVEDSQFLHKKRKRKIKILKL